MKCPKCNGSMHYDTSWCNFCYGKKELDWIEIIFGVDSSYREHINTLINQKIIVG